MKIMNIFNKINAVFIFYMGFICALFMVYPSHIYAQIDTEEEYDILPEIRTLCHSSLGYDRGMDTQFAINRYHKQQNCIINGALEKMRNNENGYFSKQVKKFVGTDLPAEDEIKNLECDDDRYNDENKREEVYVYVSDYEKVLNKQRNSGLINSSQKYQTYCSMESENTDDRVLVKKDYSPCRLAETMLNEYCSYDIFIKIRSNDIKIIKKEIGEKDGQRLLNKSIETRKNLLKNELMLSELILEKTINEYKTIYQSFQKKMWSRIMNAQLFEITTILEEYKHKYFSKMLAKFNNAQGQ